MNVQYIEARLPARPTFIAIALPAFHVTFFKDEYATSLTADLLTLGELRELVLAESAPVKAGLRWLKFARFGDKRTAKNSLRNDANMLAISGVEGDYDGKKLSFDHATAVLSGARVRALVYTSPSYTEAAPKWRVICPTSRELALAEREKLLARVNGLFGGIFANESFTNSQSYYFGRALDNVDADHRCEIVDGDFIDERDDLDENALGKEGKPIADKKTDDELIDDVVTGRALHTSLCALAARWCVRMGTVGAIEKLYEIMDRSRAQHDRPDDWQDRRDDIQRLVESAANKFPQVRTDNAPACSEEAIALDFAARHADGLRYVAKWSRWFIWDGTCWREDDKRRVFTLARGLCRDASYLLNSASDRRKVASAKTRAAVVSLAGEDERIVAGVGQWDTDSWLLNTPGGVVDLRTGELREHRAGDYMTKITAVAPAGDCPTWKAFLREVTAGDKELQGYLQRIAGYCLTGVTLEQELYFLYGTGNNGKGVFVRTISGVIGDYHRATSIDAFVVSQSERHPTDLAGLRGARLVTATETDEGRRWAEARIKELTGGDEISARFMHQDFFEYVPQFKLVFSGNYMPTLRSVNKAIRRRFNRIPFAVTIADDKIDLRLEEDGLKPEWSGILTWMIEGCRMWQRDGLHPPQAVLDATEQYLESQDVIGEWLGEKYDLERRGDFVGIADLYSSWKWWAEDRGEYIGSERWLSQKLEDRGGLRKGKDQETRTKRGFWGLRPKPAAADKPATNGGEPARDGVTEINPGWFSGVRGGK
jgi:putative DNA primase/helicase